MKFADLRLNESILRAIEEQGYETATPIQAHTIPETLAGRDVLGCAQTGTGKTAAFALPLLQLMSQTPQKGRRLARTLVLAPTRELAGQIADSFKTYGKHLQLNGTVIYGGVSQNPQVKSLKRGVDTIIATPGRLLDLIEQGHCDLSGVQHVVLDEADRMLDMGFMPDIKRITKQLPDKRQTLFFSATMPREIRKLADVMLDHPAEVTIKPESPAVERIEQTVYHVDKTNKSHLLEHLIDTLSISRAIVFSRTKHGADRIVRKLNQAGTSAAAIHGNKSQSNRQRSLDQFRDGKIHILVATDIAARGIDVDGVSHVFNFDVSRDPESHVHRIGRTARAGCDGAAITFCDRDEVPHLKAIERMIKIKIDVAEETEGWTARNTDSDPSHGGKSRSNRSNNNGNKNKRPRRRSNAQGQSNQAQSNGQPKKKHRKGDSQESQGHAGNSQKSGQAKHKNQSKRGKRKQRQRTTASA